MAIFFRPDDVDVSAISGRRVAIIGYGSQGHAHALNLADSGVDVRVGVRDGSPSRAKAQAAGLRVLGVGEAAAEADVVVLLVPDHVQASVFSEAVAPNLSRGDALGFAHGFNVRYETIRPPEGVDVFMVAPAGPGHLLRRTYTEGSGLPALVAVAEDATGAAWPLAVAYADALGSTRAAVIRSSFEEETETDLFGEQVVLCGGMTELARSGFATLVDAGYQPEVAYFECLHQLKLIADLLYEEGIGGMQFSISDTAEYGALTRGPRIVSDAVREQMRGVLGEIQDGSFAAEWIEEANTGGNRLRALAEGSRADQIERVGERLRAMMPFLSKGERFEDASGG